MRKRNRTIATIICATAAVAIAGTDVSDAASATWELNPGSGDWNTASNWTPASIPNGSADTATFDLSNTTAVSISANTEVEGIVFNANASAFTITTNPSFILTISGTGITNNSGVTQNFLNAVDGAGNQGRIYFMNSATAGSMTVYTNNGATISAVPAITNFYDMSTAGSATFINNGGAANMAGGGGTQFIDAGTSAGTGMFTNNGGTAAGSFGGSTNFVNGTAANGTFINNPGEIAGAGQGRTIFQNSATAENGNITNNGATVAGAVGGSTEFLDTSTAATSTITSNGGDGAGAGGGLTQFRGNAANVFESSFAGDATLIANGGTNGGDGGRIQFIWYASGENATVQLHGNGNLDISGLFSEGTTIGSLEGDGDVFLGSKNLAIGTLDSDTTFSGLIQDGGLTPGTGGSITKVGRGTLTLDSDNTYTGGTTINEGVLAIGSLNAMGTGNVTVNTGTLQTANGPRPMAVGGNYFQNPGGTLRLQIGGLDSGAESDYLTVNGSASLGGKLTLLRINNFTPSAGDRVDIIGDLGGHSGTFDSVTSTFTGMIQPVVHYDELLDIYIVFELTSFQSLAGLTPNQESVAKELDSVRSDPAASNLIDFLITEPLANLPHDYDLIAPEELAGIYELGFSLANVQALNLQRRMDDIRGGSNGFSANGYSMRDSYGLVTTHPDGSVEEKSSPRYMQPSAGNRWGVFVTGTGEFANVGDEDLNARGYDITTGGVTLGLDYRVTNNFAIGLAGTYAHSNVDLVGDGHIDADGGKLALFATFFTREFYFEGAATGGLTNYDTRRGALLGDANGSTDGAEFHGLVAAGYDWTIGCFTFGPTASFQYSYIDFNSFTESGSLAPLHYPDQNEDAERSAVGLRALCNFKVGSAIIRPEVRAAWKHEYGNRSYAIDSQFASGAGDVFSVWGPTVGRDSVLVSGGIGIQWSNSISTFVAYDGDLGRKNYDAHNVSGGISFGF